jgi:hypothetical protein
LGNRDYTEYTSMEFLAERAPDIPAPRPYGLIAFGPVEETSIDRKCLLAVVGSITFPHVTEQTMLEPA